MGQVSQGDLSPTRNHSFHLNSIVCNSNGYSNHHFCGMFIPLLQNKISNMVQKLQTKRRWQQPKWNRRWHRTSAKEHHRKEEFKKPHTPLKTHFFGQWTAYTTDMRQLAIAQDSCQPKKRRQAVCKELNEHMRRKATPPQCLGKTFTQMHRTSGNRYNFSQH